MTYYYDVFEINGGHYAIPETFKDFDENREPVLQDNPMLMSKMIPENFIRLSNNYDDACREVALRVFRDEWQHSCHVGIDGNVYLGNKHFRVLTDREAEAAANVLLEAHIDAHLPDEFRSHFDEKGWKERALATDGRGFQLSKYDHTENVQEIVPNTFYIYRQR